MMKMMLLLMAVVPSVAFGASGKLDIAVFPQPPRLSAGITFSEPSGNGVLDAEETAILSVTVTNSGEGDAFDVKAELTAATSVSGLTFPAVSAIGTVPAGSTVTKKINIVASEGVLTEAASFVVDVKEANGFDAAPMKISFHTKAFEPPSLVVADIGINSRTGKPRVEPMEIVELTARVQNVGHGDARSVTADIQLGPNVFLAGDAGTHFDLGAIPSGEFRDVKFTFYTNNRIKNGSEIPITLSLGEARPRFAATHPLKLAMSAPQKQIHEVVIRGQETPKKGDIPKAGGLSVDVDQNIPEGPRAGKYDVAVIIGNRDYGSSGSLNVEFALRDAQVMKEYLTRTMGYDPDNIIYAEDATLSKFNEYFGTERDARGKLFKYVKPGESRVFIYYVGHGAPDLETHEAYFVPVDANPQYIKANGYRLQTFYDNLAKIPAKSITVVLDSCFSGNSEKGMLFKNISPALVKVKKDVSGPSNAVVMTSAGLDQVSTWYPEKRHSLFTYYFLKGLQGEADPQKTGRITVGMMKSYLQENVPYMARRLTGNEQQPVVTGRDEEVLAVVKR